MSFNTDTSDDERMYICFGFGCMNIGCLVDAIYGCSIKNECCCFKHDCCFLTSNFLTCRDKSEGEYIRIGCLCDAITLQIPRVICKQTCHLMCLVCACSVPPDEEVPCILACCTIVIAVIDCNLRTKCQNCMTLGETREIKN